MPAPASVVTDPSNHPSIDTAAVHMQKLAVGISSVEALRRRVAQRLAGKAGRHIVLTRMMPVRRDALVAGGSMYWVIAGQVRARQRIVAMDAFGKAGSKAKGAKRCRITLDPEVVETECVPRKPFQGWRYLRDDEAPRDLTVLDPVAGLDPAFHRQLAELGLL